MKKTLIVLIAFIFLFGLEVTGHALEMESLGVDIHGFVSQGFLKSTNYNYLANDSNKGSFQYNEMGINFGKQVTDNLRIGAQLFARDLGDVANNKVTLDWAYGDYRFKDWLGVRAGRIKTPFGLYNETRDMDMLRACIVLPQGIYNEFLRDSIIAMNGAALYGTIPISVLGSLEYQLQAGVGNIDVDNGAGKYLGNAFRQLGINATFSNFNSKTSYAGALRWATPLSGLALKATFMQSEEDMPVTIFGVINTKSLYQIYSAEYIWKDLTLAVEYATVTADVNLNVPVLGPSSSTTRSESYYGMGSYRFTKWLEAGAYYSVSYPNAGASEKNGDNYIAAGQHDYFAWQKDAALFVRFDINNYLILKLEGHYVDGTSDVMVVDNPTRDDKNWWYFAAKVTFSF